MLNRPVLVEQPVWHDPLCLVLHQPLQHWCGQTYQCYPILPHAIPFCRILLQHIVLRHIPYLRAFCGGRRSCSSSLSCLPSGCISRPSAVLA
jgi:hypothetical protein